MSKSGSFLAEAKKLVNFYYYYLNEENGYKRRSLSFLIRKEERLRNLKKKKKNINRKRGELSTIDPKQTIQCEMRKVTYMPRKNLCLLYFLYIVRVYV